MSKSLISKRRKAKFPILFECFGCKAKFGRRRALHKHQAGFWPWCPQAKVFM